MDYEVIDRHGNVLISSWDRHASSSSLALSQLQSQKTAHAELIRTSHGIRVRGLSPMFDATGALSGVVAVYFGLHDVAEQIAQRSGGHYLLVEKTDTGILPAGKWIDPTTINWLKSHPLKFHAQPEMLLAEDKVIVSLPLQDSLYNLLILPAETYTAPIEKQKHIVFIDVLVVVIIDMIVNLIVLFTIYRDAVRPIKSAMVSMQAITDNRLDVPLNTRADSRDMRTFVHQQENMRTTLQRIVGNIRQHAEDLDHCSEHTYDNVTQICSLIKQNRSEASELTQTANHLNNMASTVADKATEGEKEARASARFVAQSSQEIGETADMLEHLGQGMSDSVKDIAELVREIDNISDVLNTIHDIAEQTNLLALNAAIEAARAGEHGRGFAVVADEVRTLATKTQQTVDTVTQKAEAIQRQATTTQSRMNDIAAEAEQAVGKSERLQEELTKIRKEVDKIAHIMSEIAAIARDQNDAVKVAREQIEDIERQVDTMARRSNETLTTFEQVKSMSHALAGMVRQFSI